MKILKVTKIVKELKFKGVWGRIRIKKKFPETKSHKILENSSRFHVEEHATGSLISVFQEFSASINKKFILAGRLGTRLSFYGA